MANRVRISDVGKRLLHAAVLLFTSYWLIATSAPTYPARDCYTGLDSSASILVTLADALVEDGGSGGDAGSASTLPSCQGLDGIVPGAALLLDLERAPRPHTKIDACYGYELAGLEGAEGVSSFEPSRSGLPEALVLASGPYSAPEARGCRGHWSFSLSPATKPPEGALVSPLDAGPSEPWILERSIRLEQAHFCPGFTTRGQLHCKDRFDVKAITEAP